MYAEMRRYHPDFARVELAPGVTATLVRNMRRSWFDGAAKAARLEGCTPHVLRHTAVSQGASVLAIQRMLGHDKPSTTLIFYSDLFDDDLDDVAARLDAARTSFSAAYEPGFWGRPAA
ncbi:tyrosine-type recombinase/integrase [Nocardia noduli]|uniref:tyrosine-type recombinase/integrase n=1 Tax=Nocardia noduli TaxID=2815722 RepID=UPI001C23866E|nr:tyrosine-type recombinase/integrase [Nocardia noduli]